MNRRHTPGGVSERLVRLLLTQCPPEPESKLLVAVIVRAALDACGVVETNVARGHGKTYVEHGRGFFGRRDFEHYCGLLTLEPEWVRSKVRQMARAIAKSPDIKAPAMVRENAARLAHDLRPNNALRVAAE